MTDGAFEDQGRREEQGPDAGVPRDRRPDADDFFPNPTAGMVVLRVLAMSARSFLLNDADGTAERSEADPGRVDAGLLTADPGPLWRRSAVESAGTVEQTTDPIERVHQTRVAMRRIRSNLRTYRLLLDPSWGTTLRAELAWYGSELGRARDLALLASVVAERGADVLDPAETARIGAVIGWERRTVDGEVAVLRTGDRHRALLEQMAVLWDGPEFKAKAAKPAADVLPAMLHRTWRDLRGTARAARKDPSDAHLHRLRIRLKDLRYGAETAALVAGTPAAKTARAAERLQRKLGDLHDVTYSISWLERLAADQVDLADAAQRLAVVQRDRALDVRKGWKRELKEVERRWRRWQG